MTERLSGPEEELSTTLNEWREGYYDLGTNGEVQTLEYQGVNDDEDNALQEYEETQNPGGVTA
jgi:hypothetical protein